MDEFNEGEREGLPGAPAIVYALGREATRALGQEVHDDGVDELLSAPTADAITEEGVGFSHVAHDDGHTE